MGSVEVIAGELQSLQRRLMARQEEAAVLRRQIEEAIAGERNAFADGKDREADTFRRQNEQASSKLAGISGGIEELQKRIIAVEQELAEADKRLGDAGQRLDYLLNELDACVAGAVTALHDYMQHHDPRGLMTLMTEAKRAERGAYIRRTGQSALGNSSAEQRLIDEAPFGLVLQSMVQYQLATGAEPQGMTRARKAIQNSFG